MDENRFTAYKQTVDGNADRRGYVYGLSFKECQELPLGLQSDNTGDFIWAFGINNGNEIR